MSNQDVANSVWQTAAEAAKTRLNVHKICGLAVNALLATAIKKGSTDNVSAILITFPHFEKALEQKGIHAY